MSKYNKLIVKKRLRTSGVKEKRNIIEATESDRSRAIFSSSFRRLQQKAQVFSLETNASIRSRLTHSLEVADYGRIIAQKVAFKLKKKKKLPEELILPFINIVETACILHDIGNPPFGHFGECAIRDWFDKNKDKIRDNLKDPRHLDFFNELIHDFLEFDGNPQGLRVITLLQGPEGKSYIGTGLNLTISQIYCFLKYIRVTNGEAGSGITKKPGYFNSEKHVVEKIQKLLKHNKRFPLTYIMEAADDIAYCLSDIEDGIEKSIIDINDFFGKLKRELKKKSKNKKLLFNLDEFKSYRSKEKFFQFKTGLARKLINYASDSYIQKHNEILKGEIDQLFENNSEAFIILEALRDVSRKILFRSEEVEDKELAGYKIISGLLEHFSPLLKLKKEQFNKLISSRDKPSKLYKQKLDIEWRLFNKLPPKYVEAYQFSLKEHKFTKAGKNIIELFFRAHLIVDFISGMTDNYALELYRLLNGIEID